VETTKTVTAETTAVRFNDDGSVVYVKTVTYSDTTTDILELLVDRLVP
jgi:hypothetical protein